jgi:histidinol-phosphate aminotransferase
VTTPLPIRDSLLDHERDTYLSRAHPVSADDALAAGGFSALEPIDCLLGCGQWGLAPLARAAYAGFDLEALAHYPERFHETLLAPALLWRFAGHGVTAEQLFLGHGSFNLLERIVHKLVRPGCLLGIGPQFAEIPSEWKAAGGSYLPLPLEAPSYTLPLAALENALARDPVSLVYVDNPNNPLGRHFPLADMEQLATLCARHSAILVVDEALGDFIADEESCIRLTTSHENVIVTRSFSKALGLAAERVGYAFFSPALAEHYRPIDVPFEPGLLAATLARETLRDAAFLGHVRAEVVWAKAEIVRALGDAGLQVLPTHPGVSILTVHAPARDLRRQLRSRGVLVQAGSSFGRTHAAWDDSYCRLRIVGRPLVTTLCERIRSLQ